MVSQPVSTLEVTRLNKVFYTAAGQPVEALKECSISLKAGQVYSLLGPVRAGKTTLLQLLAGMQIPTSGAIFPASLTLSVLIDEFSKFYRLDELLPAEQLLQQTADENGQVNEEQLAEVVEGLGLTGRSIMPLRHLNSLERLLLNLALDYLKGANLFLLDEPLYEASSDSIQAMKKAFTWMTQRGKTVVLATRQPKQALAVGHEVIFLFEGRLVARQKVNEVLARLEEAATYTIRVKGRLDTRRWSDWFDGLDIISESSETILSGQVPDQAALQGVLTKVHDLGLSLLSLEKAEPDIERLLLSLNR
ncbi:MAG TPA: ATP-binding cassette domain-containing protein [Chloroflexia bacterium]|nr:ATP-binding cassette domain-containing protein [Chloroflexia bacterium]